jgi:UDP-GlcNAc:undecaprenyl-phosphate/decaprenyl-phosphate GlcNAc-1-phosphate transferase
MTYLGIVSMIVAMAVASMLTPWVIRIAERMGAMDRPGERKTHVTPMPRIGGVAVFAGFIAGIATAALLSGALLDPPRVDVYWSGFVVAATGMFIVGLIDDLTNLSYRIKFAAQFACAGYVWFCGFRIEILTDLSNPLGGAIDLGWLSLPITVLWIVGITNAVNLIDGLDGLAAGTALITTLSVGVIGFHMSSLGVTASCVALAGSLIGFLRYNFNPARIFLGDSGSMFLGFVLAVISARGSQKLPTTVVVLVPLLVLALPLLDTSMAVARRLYWLTSHTRTKPHRLRYLVRNLDSVFSPDREHIHHRLLDLGLSHRAAVLALYGVGVASATVAFVLTFVKSLEIGFLLLGVLVGSMGGLVAVLYLRARAGDAAPAVRAVEPQATPQAKPNEAGLVAPESGAQSR